MISSNPTKEKLSVLVKQDFGGELKGEERPELFIIIPKSSRYPHPHNAVSANRTEHNPGKNPYRYIITLSQIIASNRYFA